MDHVQSSLVKEKFLGGISHTLQDAGLFAKSIEYSKRTIDLLEKRGDEENLAKTYGNLAITLDQIGELELAEKYNRKGIELFEKIGNRNSLPIVQMNLGQVLHQQGRDDEALMYFQKCQASLEQTSNPYAQAAIYDHIGWFYKDKEDYPNAEKYLMKGFEAWSATPELRGQASSLIGLSDVYRKLGNPRKALDYGRKAEEIANKTGDPEVVLDAKAVLHRALSDLGQFEEALRYLEEVNRANDSLQGAANSQAALEMDLRNDFELLLAKDSIENVQRLEQEASEKEAARTQRDIFLYGGIGVGLLLAGFLIFAVKRYRTEAKQKGIIEEQRVMP